VVQLCYSLWPFHCSVWITHITRLEDAAIPVIVYGPLLFCLITP
jgi:hypothetical protein